MEEAALRRFFENDRFAKYLGIELLEVGAGRALARLQIDERHLNGVGVIHGGAIFALADLAFAVASNSHGQVALGINVSIAYVKGATGGPIFAEATEVSLGPRLATYQIRVHDQAGETLASFQGTVYRKRERLEDLGD